MFVWVSYSHPFIFSHLITKSSYFTAFIVDYTWHCNYPVEHHAAIDHWFVNKNVITSFYHETILDIITTFVFIGFGCTVKILQINKIIYICNVVAYSSHSYLMYYYLHKHIIQFSCLLDMIKAYLDGKLPELQVTFFL